MTHVFAGAVNLRRAIRACLDRIKHHGHDQATVYVANACHVIYSIVAPPGINSAQERHDLGHYRHNFKACQVYLKVIGENKRRSRGQLNHKARRAWVEHAKKSDKGFKYIRPDFSYVNDMLEDHACIHYKHHH
jgi:hypothetical protein